MTEKQIFQNEIKCIKNRDSNKCNGGIDCNNCKLVMKTQDIINCYNNAINRINELEQKEIEIQELKEEIKYNEKLYLRETKISNAYSKTIDYLQEEINKLQNIITITNKENKHLREQNKFLLKKKTKEIRMSTKIEKSEIKYE